jgi:hypothetical protein
MENEHDLGTEPGRDPSMVAPRHSGLTPTSCNPSLANHGRLGRSSSHPRPEVQL